MDKLFIESYKIFLEEFNDEIFMNFVKNIYYL